MINYVLMDKVKEDIVYIGDDKRDLSTALYDYVVNQPHIDENLITENDLHLLKYSSLRKIGLTVYAEKIR